MCVCHVSQRRSLNNNTGRVAGALTDGYRQGGNVAGYLPQVRMLVRVCRAMQADFFGSAYPRKYVCKGVFLSTWPWRVRVCV